MTEQLPKWNPYNKKFIEDPFPFLEQLRSKEPIHKGITGDWIATRYEDVKAVLADKSFHTLDVSEIVKQKQCLLKEEVDSLESLHKNTSKWILYMDPPEHTDLRRIVYKAWLKLKFDEKVNQIIYDLVQDLTQQSSINFVTAAAEVIPIKVVCAIMGIENPDLQKMRRWFTILSKVPEPFTHLRNLKLASKTTEEFTFFLEELIGQKKQSDEVGDDFISILLDECQDQLSHEEIISVLQLIFFAGTETTIIAFGLTMDCLVDHPEKWQQLNTDNESLSAAVEELIRYNPPLRYTVRIPTVDSYIGGQLIKKGEKVFLCIASSNRDPSIFDNPQHLNLERHPNPHLSFGYAGHYCLGAKLAKIEILYFFKYLKEANIFFEREGEANIKEATVIFRSLATLPLKVIHNYKE